MRDLEQTLTDTGHDPQRVGEVRALLSEAMMVDPEWSQKLKQLVIMGGAFDVRNVLHELNAAYDPEATHIVLNSGAPLLIVPLDVTTRTFMRLGDIALLDGAGTPLATYPGHTARPWITWLAERFGEDGCALHDPLALAALLDPRVIGTPRPTSTSSCAAG